MGPCPYTFEDRDWLPPGGRIDSLCWSGGPRYQNGIEISNLRETILHSPVSYDRFEGRCAPRAIAERVIILRVRSLDAPRCPEGYRLRYRRDGSPECWRLPEIRCTIALAGLPAEAEPGRRLENLAVRLACRGRLPARASPSPSPPRGRPRKRRPRAHHDSCRPAGTVSFPRGNVADASGYVPFVFTAPAPAGDHRLTASCTNFDCGQASGAVWVGVRGLQAIGKGPWVLVGQNDAHPSNHYLTAVALAKITRLAELYHERFPNDPTLRLNDASLERGGLFDITHPVRSVWWTPPHKTHRRGTEIDVRANEFVHADAIPHRNYFDFEDLAEKVHCKANMHDEFTRNQHYHVACR